MGDSGVIGLTGLTGSVATGITGLTNESGPLEIVLGCCTDDGWMIMSIAKVA
jgi:hypothetical protein